MQLSLNPSSAQPIEIDRSDVFPLRGSLRASDAETVEKLVAQTGVFNADEISVARSLVEETLAEDKGEYFFLMADGAEGLDGYVCYGPIPGTDRRYELYWIAVSPRAAKHGLGRKLLRATEDAVRLLGGTHIFAETSTRADYVPAHALYQANGYRKEAVIPDYHADGDGMAIFAKRL